MTLASAEAKPFGSKRPRRVRRASGFEPDTPPPGVNAHSRPRGPALGVPSVHQRVDAGAVEGLAPSRPVEAALWTPRSLPPAPLPFPHIGVAVQPSIGSAATYRQDGQTEEREFFKDRVDPFRCRIREGTQSGLIESQSVAFHSDGLTGQRSPNPCYRRFHFFVELHQPMVQPLDRPRAGGIERSVRDLAVLIDTQIGHRRRQRPGTVG